MRGWSCVSYWMPAKALWKEAVGWRRSMYVKAIDIGNSTNALFHGLSIFFLWGVLYPKQDSNPQNFCRIRLWWYNKKNTKAIYGICGGRLLLTSLHWNICTKENIRWSSTLPRCIKQDTSRVMVYVARQNTTRVEAYITRVGQTEYNKTRGLRCHPVSSRIQEESVRFTLPTLY